MMKSKAFASVLVIILSMLSLIILNSCASQQAGGPPPPPPRAMRAEGQPSFHAGLPVSYWIWHDRNGWHLRVTTAGLRRHFSGTVESTAGFIDNFHPTRLEWRDRVRVEGGRLIRFDFWTHGDIDGFDWRTTSGCNAFNLYIDGAPHPERVFLGAFGDSPPAAAFEACW